MTSKDLYPSCRHYQLGAGVGPEDVSIIVDFNNGRLGNQVPGVQAIIYEDYLKYLHL